MTRDEFLKLEFETLLEEIKEAKTRSFQIVGISLVAVPTAHFLADTYKIDTLVLMLPFLVMVAGLLYLSENHAIMRCGRYIKLFIEPHVPDVTGWDCFYLIFFVYFVGSVFLAGNFARTKYGVGAAIALVGSYVVLGVLFAGFLRTNIRLATTTKTDGTARG